MQLHALDRRVIAAHDALAPHDALRIKHHIVVILGIADISVNRQVITDGNFLQNALIVRLL